MSFARTKIQPPRQRAGLIARPALEHALAQATLARDAAVLYISIPGTHRQWDWVVDDALASVRPT